MRITQECDYAIRIMMRLSDTESGQVVDASTISDQQKIPARFTAKILRKLILAGLIQSYKGVKGGYALNPEAGPVTLLQIIEVIDGPIQVNRCVDNEDGCNRQSAACCPVHVVMQELNELIVEKLSNITLENIKNEERGNVK